MTTLEIIRYICQHPEFKTISIVVGEEMQTLDVLSAINYFASIDPSWYDDYIWNTIVGKEALVAKLTIKKS